MSSVFCCFFFQFNNKYAKFTHFSEQSQVLSSLVLKVLTVGDTVSLKTKTFISELV